MQLKDYIQGSKHGKEANRLEREAMNDPFLRDALDGFDSVDGNHTEIIEQLEKKYTQPAFVPNAKKKPLFYWAVAASVLLVIGIGTYFFTETDKHSAPVLAEYQPAENESIKTADLPLTEIETKIQTETFIAEANIEQARSSATRRREEQNNYSLEDMAIAADTDAFFPDDVSEDVFVAAMIMAEEQEIQIIEEEIFTERKIQSIRGRVLDEYGEPLIGVSIMEKGTNSGTITDIDGNFSLQLSNKKSPTLITSYMGYVSQEVEASKSDINISLQPDILALSEVVVVGYATQRRVSMTGSVSAVRANDTAQSSFDKKEFRTWYKQNAAKNVCGNSKASVAFSFFLDENGKPIHPKFQAYSCEEAKKEMERLLPNSPVWTRKNRQVSLRVEW